MKKLFNCARKRLVAVLSGLMACAVIPGGALADDSGGTIQYSGNGNYYGSAGTLTLHGTLSAANGAVVLSGGTLVLNGTLSASTILLPAPASGTLVLSGTLTTPSGSTVIPSGSFTLGGTLTSANTTTISPVGIPLTNGLLTLNGGGVYNPQVRAFLGQPFVLLRCVSVGPGTTPTVCSAANLPAGLTIDPDTGVISGAPLVPGTFQFSRITENNQVRSTEPFELTVAPLPFLHGAASLGSGVYYRAFPNGCNFGEYSYLADPRYIYSWDLTSYEFLLDANDGGGGIYLYDFASGSWLYTSPSYSYPYVYDFDRGAVLYYYQGTANPRYFFDFGSRQIITK